MDRSDALGAIARLEALAAASSPNSDAHREVRALCLRLFDAPGPSDDVVACVTRIETWADLLYSARRHERFGGPQRVRNAMLAECASLRRAIEPARAPRWIRQ